MFSKSSTNLPKWAILAAVCFLAAAIVVIFAIFASRTFLGSALSRLPFVPNYQVINFHNYYAIDPDEISIVYENNRVIGYPEIMVENGRYYLPYTFVRDYMDTFLFWDTYSQILLLTSYDTVLQFVPEALEYIENGELRDLGVPITIFFDNAYMPVELVERLYPYAIKFHSASNILTITGTEKRQMAGVATTKADIRYLPSVDAPIMIKVDKDSELIFYETDGDFSQVRTSDGLVGYIASRELSEPENLSISTDAIKILAGESTNATKWPSSTKINMVWEHVTNHDATVLRMDYPIPEGINVISPTWFSIDPITLEITSLASVEYTEWIKSQGVYIWPMVSDVEIGRATTHAFLTDAAARRRAAASLVDYCITYGFDGINVDFEQVREEDGLYFIQFLRELAATMNNANKINSTNFILSVDVYVPSEWSMFYRRDLISLTADFIAVMTYDEFHGNSEVAGPVASFSFVEKGVQDMLNEVPADKLLMGLPFYSRIWREVINTNEVSIVNTYGMNRTVSFFDEQGADLIWDHETGTYYSEFITVEDNETIKYRTWLEDQHSIAEKLKIFDEYNLAGVASWRRLLENEATHDLLRDRVK